MAVPEMRYCIACGYNLTGLDMDRCPKCERSYDPHDPSTTTDLSPNPPVNYWTQAPRIAGYAALLSFVAGRVVLNLYVGDAQAVATENLGGAVVFPLMLVFLVTPWILLTTYLTLTALDDWVNENLIMLVGLGMLVGGLIMLLSPMGLQGLMIGALAGMFAGLVRRVMV